MKIWQSRRQKAGFTLVELLVVIGIIAVLIGMLMPALSKVQQQSKWLKCQSNLRTIGQFLQMYSNQWRGYCYPPNLGAGNTPDTRWPVQVFPHLQAPDYAVPVMLCPADDPEPVDQHSYILNDHIFEHGMKFGSKPPNGLSTSDIVLMGEKTTTRNDYYMNENANAPSDFETGAVELYRHGFRLGSNYLYMDLHVGTFREIASTDPKKLKAFSDPWDFNPDGTTVATTQ